MGVGKTVCVCGGGPLVHNWTPPTQQVPYIPLELGLEQLFQELAGEVRRLGREQGAAPPALPPS